MFGVLGVMGILWKLWSSIFCWGLYWLNWFWGVIEGWFVVKSFKFVGLEFDWERFLDDMIVFIVEFFGLRIDESWLFRWVDFKVVVVLDLFVSLGDEFMVILNLLVLIVVWFVLFVFDVVILLGMEFFLLLLFVG